MWLWTGAQTTSALFSQTLNAGLVPSTLSDFYAALAALQFVGVTLAPACYESIPFQGLWACVGVVSISLLFGVISLLIQKYILVPKSLLLRGSQLLLKLSALILDAGFGAFISASTDVVTCRLPSKMSVSDYARAASNGDSLRAALGGNVPAIELLRLATDDPFFAAKNGLTAFLRNTIPVSVLASDPYIVCGEEAHVNARIAAIFLLIVLVIGLPSLSFTSLWYSGRLKGMRRMWSKMCTKKGVVLSSTKGDSSTTPPSTFSRLAVVLSDSSIYSRASWLNVHRWLLTAACTGSAALSLRTSLLQFYILQSGVAIITLFSSILVLWLQPYNETNKWKTPVLAALYFLSMMAALFNISLRADSGHVDSLSWKLCLTLVALACATFLLLLVGWFRALVVSGETLARKKSTAVRQEVDSPPGVFNPLHVNPPGNDEQKPTVTHTWQRVATINGEHQWFCAQTGRYATSDTDLPIGALTTDGFELCQEGEEHWWWNSNNDESIWRGPWEAKETAAFRDSELAVAEAARIRESESAAEATRILDERRESELAAADATRRESEQAAVEAMRIVDDKNKRESEPILLWRRVIEKNRFFWFCDVNREVVLADSSLPHGAVSIDGWQYCRASTTQKSFWVNVKTLETAWKGPWVEDEANVLRLTSGWPKSFG